jgi:hypothetical protein
VRKEEVTVLPTLGIVESAASGGGIRDLRTRVQAAGGLRGEQTASIAAQVLFGRLSDPSLSPKGGSS